MEALKVFEKFVDEIMLENSRIYKNSVLEKYHDNDDVRFMLRYIFSPYIVNGISKKKLSKKFDSLPDIELSSRQVLETIAGMRTGSDDAIKLVLAFMAKLPARLKNLFSRIVVKNLPLGVGPITINKIMPCLIPTFNVMLAAKYEDHAEYVEGLEFTLTRKIDGSRIIMLKENGIVQFYTRAGQLYEGLVELEAEALSSLPDNIMLDGGLTLLDATGLNSAEQYKQTMKITRKRGIKTGVKMLIFDIMPVQDFYLEHCNISYRDRRKLLADISQLPLLRHFEVLPILYQGRDTSMIYKVLDEQVAKGEEGIMLNINSGLYQFTRTRELLKVKKMHDVDLEVIGLDSGSNSNENKLGAFIVAYKGYKVRVGSGIDKET